jgi:hypothetical protein
VRHRLETLRLTPGWFAARFAAQGFSEAMVEWKHFGPAGLRRGLAGHETAVRTTSGLRRELFRSARRGYRRGAAYSVLAVSRWDPGENLSADR